MNPVFVIAEAGVNHNGSLDMALELVDAATAAGADAVKFQSFRTESLVTANAPKAGYQRATTGTTESQFAMLKRLELTGEAQRRLADRCTARGVEFLSTPFDIESLRLLVDEIGVRRLKLPSGEITNAPLLMAAARTGLPLILSTGMSTLAEVEAALGVIAYGYAGGTSPCSTAFRDALAAPDLRETLAGKVTLLHCTSEYPAPFESINLRAMDTLSYAFGLPVGLSDHSEGITAGIAAAARGACVIEKHFTLSHDLPGPDHRASLEPDRLEALIRSIREVEAALGTGGKYPAASELHNRETIRKSLVAAASIREGEPFTEANLAAKRPGDGLSPFLYWDLLGRPARRSYEANETIEW